MYYPFSEVITDNGRKIVNSSLKITDGYYTMDLDALETKIVENKVKLFLLCSPHNPVGRVWSEEELRRVGEICLRHGVLVVSDEIHSDFTREGHPRTVFAKLGAEFEQNCLICTAPSKTFNLAGLQISNIFVPNPELRKKLLKEIAAAGYKPWSV
ncbi:MAG: aminotransferase class I/II-fold pyridoxal phosphate-dependent enzyme [Clostridium fessum]